MEISPEPSAFEIAPQPLQAFLELVMRVEEEFRLEISDAEITNVVTVGQLQTLIDGKLRAADTVRPTAPFYPLRKAMMSVLELPRKSIHPSTQLAVLLPEAKRIRLWKELQKSSGLKFPNLRHPKRWRNTIRTVALLAAIGFHFLMSRLFHPHGLVWVAVEFGALVAFVIVRQLFYAATPKLGLLLPMRTVGELAQALPEFNPGKFSAEALKRPPAIAVEDVKNRLALIIAEELHMDADEVEVHTAKSR
jgi:hypothetical protein